MAGAAGPFVDLSRRPNAADLIALGFSERRIKDSVFEHIPSRRSIYIYRRDRRDRAAMVSRCRNNDIHRFSSRATERGKINVLEID